MPKKPIDDEKMPQTNIYQGNKQKRRKAYNEYKKACNKGTKLKYKNIKSQTVKELLKVQSKLEDLQKSAIECIKGRIHFWFTFVKPEYRDYGHQRAIEFAVNDLVQLEEKIKDIKLELQSRGYGSPQQPQEIELTYEEVYQAIMEIKEKLYEVDETIPPEDIEYVVNEVAQKMLIEAQEMNMNDILEIIDSVSYKLLYEPMDDEEVQYILNTIDRAPEDITEDEIYYILQSSYDRAYDPYRYFDDEEIEDILASINK